MKVPAVLSHIGVLLLAVLVALSAGVDAAGKSAPPGAASKSAPPGAASKSAPPGAASKSAPPSATSKSAPPDAATKASTAKRPPSRPPAAPVPANQIGVVDGIPILNEEWDRLSKPYFEEVEARAGRPLTDDEKRLLRRNVLDELIRERLWLADALRRGMRVSEPTVESRMKQSPFFKTNGQPDEAKFQAFKHSTTSNYPEIRAGIERAMILEDYTRWMERRFGPREAEVKKAFDERTSLASIRYFALGPDAVSLEPEATPAEIRAYYSDHPDEFETPEEAKIQYVRIPFTAEAPGDSSRDGAERAAERSALDFLSAIKSGSSAETIAKKFGGLHDSGPFRLGDPIRGLGRSEAVTNAVRATQPGAWVSPPVRLGPSFVVIHVLERKAPRRIPFREALPQAKHRADTALRDAELDSMAREEVRSNPEAYWRPRVTVGIVARAMTSFDGGRPPSAKDLQKTIDKLRKQAGISDTARAWADSVRATLPDRIMAERRHAAAMKTMKDAASRLAKGERAANVAARAHGVASTMESYRGQPPSAARLVEGALLDSLYTLRVRAVLGPEFGLDSVFVVRVDSLDLHFLPPYEAVRTEARAAAMAAKRAALEQAAERYFDAHRGDYFTPPRLIFDYVLFRKESPDSVRVPADSIQAYYDAHPLEFTVPGTARVRHILITFRAGDGATREAAHQKAIAVRNRILAGEDFGTVAKEVSEDPGSAPKGGQLGDITRGTVVKEFGDAAFTIPVGQVSEPVESKFGFHLIWVEERKPERLRPFSDCRDEIRGVLAGEFADSLAVAASDAFAAAASKPGASFDSLAIPYGGAKQSPPLAPSDPLADVGRIPGLEKSIGALPDSGVTPSPLPVQPGYLVARKVGVVPPERATFVEVKDRALSDYLGQRRRSIADSLNARYVPAVQAGADLDSLFEPYGGLRASKEFGRVGPIPDFPRDPVLARDSTYLSRVFASRPGSVLPPLRGATATLYSAVDTVIVLSPSDFTKKRDALLRELIDQRVEAWTARLRAKATIRIDRKDVQALLD